MIGGKMPNFSNKSLEHLETCDSRLQTVLHEVVKNFDCTIICGYRGPEEQDEAYRTGASKKQYPDGKHNQVPSRAVDVAPYPIDWNDRERFYYFAGYVIATARSMGIKLRFGGDWDRDFLIDDQTFFDLVHFEVID
jgi:hypothetical protein